MTLRFLFALTTSLFITLSVAAQAERQAENWHFGDGLLITFNEGTPMLSAGPSAMNAIEGCVSISDTNGLIQFYSNGGGQGVDQGVDGVIWNKNNDRMFDWATRGGGGISARQSSIAVPDPSGSPGRYFLFTVEDQENTTALRPPGNGLSYYLVDMTQNANLGEVTDQRERYVPLAVEALDATPMVSAEGYWVISHFNDEGQPKIITVPVTATGVGEATITDFPISTQQYTFSPDGRYLYASDNLYAYDNITGSVGELIRSFPNANGVSSGFTTDSRFMYLIEGTTRADITLVRYDLADFTRLEVERLTGGEILGISTSPFQLGPNGDLYYVESTITPPGTDGIRGVSEISCASAPTPVLTRAAVDLSGVPDFLITPNLPQYVDAIFQNAAVADTVVLASVEFENCPGTDLTLRARVSGGNYAWPDGSTDSILVIQTPGEYCVTITSGCEVTIDCRSVTAATAPNASEYRIEVSPVAGTEICDGREATVRVLHESGDASSATIITFFDGTVGDGTAVTLVEGMDISATVVDSCGATEELVYNLPIGACLCDNPVFPEIISANRDGLNDEFRAFSECELTEYSLLIFNRFGQEVFSTNTYTEGWDGTVDDKPQNIGTYLFLTSFRVEGLDEVTKVEGQFSLVR